VNYFEELGLARSAGPKDIRQAYKTLAWLLHPDRQRSENQRKLAETQMKRLNETIGILLNPVSRKEYEATLDGKAARPAPPQVIVVPQAPPERETWFHTVDARAVFLFVAGMAFASIFWYLLDVGHPQPEVRIQAAALPGPTEPDLRARVLELEERLGEVEREHKGRVVRGPALGIAGAWYYDLEGGERAGTDGSVHAAQRRGLGAETPVPGTFAGKRIDMSVAEAGGMVRGSYRSQGNPLAGQPANAVAFQFEGKGGGSHARLPWVDAAGGNGEIELRLIGPDTIETRWWAYTTGGAENAGTAVLRRRK
jgi:hypothetical protein